MTINKLALAIALTVSFSSHAGVYGTTIHSRANCVNNESITWFLWNAYTWKTVSLHHNIYGTQYDHNMDTGWEYTWRNAAVHWNEAPIGDHRWVVTGYHFFIDYGNGKVPFGSETIGDCSIYTGWWDY